MGPEGLEPSPGGLRVRCAAANTLIPFVFLTPTRNGRGGNRTLDLTLIRGLLLPLSYAPVGPKGLEPLLAGLKVRCAAVTPRPPMSVGRIRFHRVCIIAMLLVLVVALRVELSATRLSAEFGQPALDYHLPTSLFIKSGRQDSNLRSCVPKTHGFAATLHPAVVSSQYGRNRTADLLAPSQARYPGFATFCSQ